MSTAEPQSRNHLVIEPGHIDREYWWDLWRYRELLPVAGEPGAAEFFLHRLEYWWDLWRSR